MTPSTILCFLFIIAWCYVDGAKISKPISSPVAGDAKAKEARDRKVAVLNFLAGGLAGTMSSCITAPLEVVKTQLQSSRISGKLGPIGVCKELLKTDGPKGFYRGLRPLLVGIIPTRAIYFWAYSSTKAALNSTLGNSPLNHLASAFSAGITSNTITSPLWVAKTRFQILADPTVGQRKYKNYQEVVKAIWRDEGPPGFFKGLVASYIGCFEGAIQWIAYEKAKVFLSSPRMDKNGNMMEARTPTPMEYFIAAGLSKFIAICATYPHEVGRHMLYYDTIFLPSRPCNYFTLQHPYVLFPFYPSILEVTNERLIKSSLNIHCYLWTFEMLFR
jgi:solute carrier family 25 protein 33/36